MPGTESGNHSLLPEGEWKTLRIHQGMGRHPKVQMPPLLKWKSFAKSSKERKPMLFNNYNHALDSSSFIKYSQILMLFYTGLYPVL